MPQLSAEWSSITQFQSLVAHHPFQFMPFHKFTEEEVSTVVRQVQHRLASYRSDIQDATMESHDTLSFLQKLRGSVHSILQRYKHH
ncbi:MAG: hypothetical protein RML40_02530 [Bacteroidota bacterium]|nr:hypothetical protein [Candidatus Kapabacteria bacterium]MDW8219386.1 hypothetical protein [Bacteroidota bacterium]